MDSAKCKFGIVGALLGGALLVAAPLAWGDADTGATPPYGPGMMWRYPPPGPGANANGPAADGPGAMQGFGQGYGYGPGAMRGFGGGYGYGPGMMRGFGGGYGYGPGMMRGFGGGYGYGYGLGMMRGFGGGYGPGPMMGAYGAWGGSLLKLTDNQRQRLNTIHAKAARERWPLLGQMQAERFTLARLLATANPDRKAVDAAYGKLMQTGHKLLDLRIEMRHAEWAVLTSAQKKQLQGNGTPAP